MGRRGPQPKGAYADKTRVLSTRISDELRTKLEEAAAARAAATNRPQSLSSEIEHRLRMSFDYDRDVRAIFGSRETYAFFRMLSDVIETTDIQAGRYVKGARRKSDVGWLNDPYLYDQAVKAVVGIMEVFRPPGDTAMPPMQMREGTTESAARIANETLKAVGEGFTWGPGYAAHLLRAVRDADGSLPLPTGRKGGDMDALARRISADLGPVAKRLKKETTK